ncbi:ORC complex protein Cdc6/Orc1 [Natrinema pellirubrum DSM 15624]|uniref:ORC1-type DNA replication protein n=1 Tax=Natrinema pellirubrum (strain DSM 15624 / CIP 106293 / JCM 10476 / NCIMB 786 / 157) TaxID=797303 RepID=L0JMC8_NATP1|nr:orc1/cdc6 family replication initiation protein [Natrinema pellirubrum]AGB31732.1 orc1/cdc6 family replication initiation protein [Natrinema pellirubrum DSM 15624]ELY72944.1 ORC complex protein Cdc6/Orc1 [Natrinema pellirubrum DSM 15624]
MGLFQPDTDIFQERDVLREDYQPEEIVGRDEELQQYISALQPVINGDQPANIFLYGKAGVGKTACTRYLLRELKDDAAEYDVDLTTIRTNCEDLSTSYQVAIQLINDLRDPEDHLKPTGYPRRQVNEWLWEELDAIGGAVIIVFDEVDHIDDDSILYQIPRARANGNLEESKVGIIGISNDFKFRESLSSKVQSSLCEKELQFPAYNANELRDILRQRADIAFFDDVVPHEVIAKCAAFGAKDAGDARQSLDLLMEAGDVAVEQDATQVTVDHVDQARESLERSRIVDGVAGLTQQGHLVLYALLMLHEEGDTPIRARDVQDRYEIICGRAAVDPLVPRRMRDHLGELSMLGIASRTERNRGESGGRYYEYALDTNPDLLLEALDETVDMVGVTDAVQQRLDQDL